MDIGIMCYRQYTPLSREERWELCERQVGIDSCQVRPATKKGKRIYCVDLLPSTEVLLTAVLTGKTKQGGGMVYEWCNCTLLGDRCFITNRSNQRHVWGGVEHPAQPLPANWVPKNNVIKHDPNELTVCMRKRFTNGEFFFTLKQNDRGRW